MLFASTNITFLCLFLLNLALLGVAADKAEKAWKLKLSEEKKLNEAKSMKNKSEEQAPKNTVKFKASLPNGKSEESEIKNVELDKFDFVSMKSDSHSRSKTEAIAQGTINTIPDESKKSAIGEKKEPPSPKLKESKGTALFSFTGVEEGKENKANAEIKIGSEQRSSAETNFGNPAHALSPTKTTANYQEILLKFYQKHNPSKVGEVPKILLKYKV